MYETLHLELAKQRQRDLLAEARNAHLVNELKSDSESERMLAVKGVFAGIAATVSNLMKPKPASDPAPTGC
jgi:hypothetical protein